jgi:lipoyl(octanoyl) transferase
VETLVVKRPGGAAKAQEARRGVRSAWLGRICWDEALALQREEAGRVATGGPEAILLLEHDPVFTLGRNATAADILFTPQRCADLGVAVRETDRGGKVTYHGPGQLVGYPILNLSPDRRDVKRYVTDLEEVLIRTLADFGIAAARSSLRERVSSVWIGDDKVAAIGVHLSRWITTHGFALNVTDEPLANFRGIVPCGIRSGGVTTMERALGRPPELTDVALRLLPRFAEVFDREIMAFS